PRRARAAHHDQRHRRARALHPHPLNRPDRRGPMASWTNQELDRIGAAGELRIASTRADGTLRNPVIIWGVRIGDDYFVRSVHGATGGWYRGTRATHKGWI